MENWKIIAKLLQQFTNQSLKPTWRVVWI